MVEVESVERAKTLSYNNTMTTSEAEAPVQQVLPSSQNHAYEGTVLIDIYRTVPKEYENSRAVSVCPVLESFRSPKSEAFTPQFVGLGPYHHFGAKLPMTNELKFGVVKRFLEIEDISGAYQSLQSQNVVSKLEAFYHKTWESDSHTLPHVLTVDGLFLLAFLHVPLHPYFQYYSHHFILTGRKYAILPVNAAGVELSMDGVIRDLFMLENQIPVFAIKHIIQALDLDDSDDSSSQYPFSVMLEFCKAHSPFAVSDKTVSEDPHGRTHLLHIMYWLVAPGWGGAFDPQNPGLLHETLGVVITVPTLLIYLFCFGLWILLWILAYLVVVTLQPFLQIIRFILVKVIPWSGAIFGQPKLQFPTLRHFIRAVRDLWVYYVLNDPFFSFTLQSFRCLLFLPCFESLIPFVLRAIDYFSRRGLDELKRDSMVSSATIPSAAKLNEFRIRFKRVESDITSVKFDDRKGELELPCIKLDDTSEVILRNLAAYESSIFTDRFKFRSYIQFMGNLVQTHEDVKFLVDEKIIETKLSADAVIRIFKMPVGESAGSLYAEDIEDLEMRLKNVKPKVDAINNLYLILTEFLRICAVCAVVGAFFPLLSEGFHKIWCSTIFANSSGSYCGGNQVGDSAGGNDNYDIITSM